MMKIFLYLILVILGECAQTYFPSQITFSFDDDQTIFAVDEINQQAYRTTSYVSTGRQTSYVLKHFPYAIPDSPESKYYVQMAIDSPELNCMYNTYWSHSGTSFNSFPSHWLKGNSFTVDNYLKFRYNIIHSNNSSPDEDYWYSDVTCKMDSGETYPCDEIYFKKDTQIPLRFAQVYRQRWEIIRVITNYKIISIGKPDDKLFASIPKNWSLTCRDNMLGLYYNPQSSHIGLNENVKVQVWLSTPPHRINGNDTVRIQWKSSSECNDCFTYAPNELSFNDKNFSEKQTLTITRVKNGPKTTLIPIFIGGGFDVVPPVFFPIYIQ
jgi:hypothetical protein